MSRALGLWRWWQDRCDRTMDPRVLALTRICVCTVIALDLLRLAQLDLVTFLFRTYENGGLTRFVGSGTWLFVDGLSPMWGGPVAWGVCTASLVFAACGIATRPALVVALITYTQLGMMFPPGDRAIDRLLRTALLILVFSGSHKGFSLFDWVRGRAQSRAEVSAWPADLMRWVLVLVYLSAGVYKLTSDPRWLSAAGQPPLYRIIADPLVGTVDPVRAASWYGVIRVLGWITVVVELSVPLILTRWAPWWGLVGIGLHFGIAMTMNLGMFSWGMVALYPIIMERWVTRACERRWPKVQ